MSADCHKIAYISCFSGISGDMINGALIACGVPFDYIRSALTFLPSDEYELSVKDVQRCSIKAVKFDVFTKHQGSFNARTWSDVEEKILSSNLKQNVKDMSLAIFKNLFDAEALAHGKTYDKTHLHELSAIDCMIDIIGAALSLDYLGVDEVIASPINAGSGFVKTAHGTFPAPAPATLELLKGIPFYTSNIERELTTPTGAAIVKTIASKYGNSPTMTVDTIGYGAGGMDLTEQPNVVRVMLGKSEEKNCNEDKITIIETTIDDMQPQIYDHLINILLENDALDVFITPIIMKKSRPAVNLTVLCYDIKKHTLCDIIFKETTTIGIRFYEASRFTLKRQVKTVNTKYGAIRVKAAYKENRGVETVINVSAEYDDCKKAAESHGAPLKTVIAEALAKYKEEADKI
ncbi:protein of unknown function DUF111 [Candidatus Magnetoovum chiemensis]|nr:protein of unknown function DUF111 [Candidatus Magnetoovum chiemensis]